MSHIAISGEDDSFSQGMGMCLTGNGDVPHWEWGCASLGMGMCLTGNGDVPHWEWRCASLGMHTITAKITHCLRQMTDMTSFKRATSHLIVKRERPLTIALSFYFEISCTTIFNWNMSERESRSAYAENLAVSQL